MGNRNERQRERTGATAAAAGYGCDVAVVPFRSRWPSAVTICTFTLVFIQLSLAGVFVCPLQKSHALPGKLYYYFHKLYKNNNRNGLGYELTEAGRAVHGHPLCSRAFICQTIQQRVGFTSAPWATSTTSSAFSNQQPAPASASASASASEPAMSGAILWFMMESKQMPAFRLLLMSLFMQIGLEFFGVNG